MTYVQLALNNIRGSAFRSWAVLICALVVAGFALTTTLIMRGAENSLRLALERLGADIIVVPQGSQTDIEGALLMGTPTRMWMPKANLASIAAVPGVAAASPQLYLTTLTGASCCSVSDMFLIAYDPKTDFTLQPWLKQKFGDGLRLGEAVGGRYVAVPEGEQNIKVYGYFISLKTNLEPTGTGLDQSMFLTFETAQDIARLSKTQAQSPLVIPANSVSSIMVKVAPGADLHQVAVQILQSVPNVTPIESSNLFQAYRLQMTGLLKSMLVILGITWALSIILMGLVFSIVANDRRRELGVLRALGATGAFVFKSLLVEAGVLALGGGGLGIILSILVITLFHKLITVSLGFPFVFPAPLALAGQIGIGLLAAVLSVVLAVLFPALKISRLDPAEAMRE
jgi:putative ABC transport system permease protein